MNQFKFLKITDFEYLLTIYESVKASIQEDINHLQVAQNINVLLTEQVYPIDFYKQSIDILTESTFLQIYTKLEAALYNECDTYSIMKKASISRFESALSEQGYSINNEDWQKLLGISKVRNCLLHGNGRLDADRYGLDTKDTITILNADAHKVLIETGYLDTNRKESSTIRLHASFLY